MMKVTWNGTGAAWSYRYGNASAVLESGGHRLLMDCGHTVPGRLDQMGMSLQDFDAVFISHLHGDHIYGLEEWGFKNLMIWKRKPQLIISHDLANALWTDTLAGTMAQPCDDNNGLRDYFDVTVMHVGQPQVVGPWTLDIHPVRHIPGVPAYGLKAGAGNSSVAFTCDSLADADPWFYQDTDLVFHDCSFRPACPKTVHAHFEELREYPEEFRSKTYLVHYEDMVNDLRQDPEWQADLAGTGMRLTDPFVPFTFGKP